MADEGRVGMESYSLVGGSAALTDYTAGVIAAALVDWGEALVRRMLCHWDPAWGLPSLIEGPPDAKLPLWAAFDPDEPEKHTIAIAGLARANDPAVLMVRAVHHIAPNCWPLPPVGPWPLPRDSQWKIWAETPSTRARLPLERTEESAPPAATGQAQAVSSSATSVHRDQLRTLVAKHGGEFHGPRVEHISMEEEAFWRFLDEVIAMARNPGGGA